ncbi:MAG: AraC family transcriptional regulator [Gemmatimonadota bacterium]|nr:AraC family transcriptional regulator [Gemmatimonadota bacterium]
MARLVEITRPHAVLPYQEELPSASLRQALARPPLDLAAAVTDYLAWRGIPTDQETRRLIRKIVDLSADLRSVSGLSRHLYLSRRALGRRFLTNGLPVPSHWLHFARLLRAALQIQNTDDSVVSVAYGLGYPDGFSLSNQMYRLTGHRPQTVRTCLGWEWIIEAWLRREADRGGLAPEFTQGILAGEMVQVQSALDRESEDRVAG